MDSPWLNELLDQVEELLSNPKKVKFNTCKNRKAFINNVKNLITTAVETNTTKKEDVPTRHSTPTITKPMPDRKPLGFAVMTESMSQQGDEQAGVGPSTKDDSVTKIQEHKAGVRRW